MSEADPSEEQAGLFREFHRQLEFMMRPRPILRSGHPLLLGMVFSTAALAVPPADYQPRADWLVDPKPFRATVERSPDGASLVLQNGLFHRTIRLRPVDSTAAFDNLMTGQSVLRGPRPEAVVTLNGRKIPVGGWTGQPNQAHSTRRAKTGRAAMAAARRACYGARAICV